MNIIAELKSITRTRKILNSLLWVIVGGAVFYSLMTSTPLVSDHSQWSWSGWALGLITDAAFILAISADAVLSKHGMNGGRWAIAFRWVTGAASLFLNTWGSVSERDWVGVAIHSIAPAVLVCAAEVAPAYRRRFRDLELQLSGSQVQGSQSRVQSELTEVHGSEPIGEPRAGEYLSIPAVTSSGSNTEAGSSPGSRSKRRGSSSQAGSKVQVHSSSPGSGSNGETIRAGFMNNRSASEVAREIGVSPSYVSRKYKELREELALTA